MRKTTMPSEDKIVITCSIILVILFVVTVIFVPTII